MSHMTDAPHMMAIHGPFYTVDDILQKKPSTKNTLVVNLFGGPGCGKCFRKGTKILMHDGRIKNVEDININDYVMGVDSTPRKVVNLSNGIDTLYAITPIKGESYVVTGNHILPLKYNHHGIEKDVLISVNEFMELSEFKRNRLKQYRNGVEFLGKELPLDPYYIGLWLGDGSSNDPTRITNIDTEVIIFLNQFGKQFGLTCKQVGNSVTYAITNGRRGGVSNYIRQVYNKLQLINNKHIPLIYKTASRRDRLSLLAGLIDSDGYVYKNCCEICQLNDTLTDDILYLCRSLGLGAYKTDKIVNGVKYNRIIISGDMHEVPTLIKRKKFTKRLLNKSVLRTGIQVKRLSIPEEYYGFEVDGDHLFLMGDFTVTHNSTIAAGLFHQLKLKGVSCELVTEYAKRLTWQEASVVIGDQIKVFAEQHHAQYIVKGKVDVVITDSPILFSLIYGDTTNIFKEFVRDTFDSYNNFNYYIPRKFKFDPVGRYQSEDEAKCIDDDILDMLYDNGIPFYNMRDNLSKVKSEQVTQFTTALILEDILTELKL